MFFSCSWHHFNCSTAFRQNAYGSLGFHEQQGRLHAPILGCCRHLRALRFLDGKSVFYFAALRTSKLESLIWEYMALSPPLYGHFTPNFCPPEGLYLTFYGWEKAVTFHAVILKIWALTDLDSLLAFHQNMWNIVKLLGYVFMFHLSSFTKHIFKKRHEETICSSDLEIAFISDH